MHEVIRRAVSATTALIILLIAGCSAHLKNDELQRIRARGYLECGVRDDAYGFSLRDDASGNYAGLEADVCRAVAIAILGKPAVRFVAIDTLTQFRQQQDIDIVLHGLTWSYDRAMAYGFQFSPAYFHDGQAFMRIRRDSPSEELTPANGTICVVSGRALRLLKHEFAEHPTPLHVMTVASEEQALTALLAEECSAMTADVSVLTGLLLSHPQYAAKLEILPKRLTKEPLCALTRREESGLSAVVEWTIYALVEADELGITSANVKQMATDSRSEIDDFLNLTAARDYGQDPDWVARVIEQVGNYAELYERSVGSATVAKLPRGQNEIWERGGLLYSPPFSLR